MSEGKVEKRTQIGYITTQQDDKKVSMPIELTIIDTFYDDGRKDVTIQVPKLAIKPQQT